MAGVSKELIEQARNADLFAYLQSYEPTVLKRDGPITAIRNMTVWSMSPGKDTGTGTAVDGA